jgi:hypothetical protein
VWGQERWFCRDGEDSIALGGRLKLMPCPHCKVVGMLVWHGYLRGFDETSTRPSVRARRVFCSNRNARRGCGRTLSVWYADKIRRLSLTAGCLWQFLQRAVAGTMAAASAAAGCQRSDRTWQRIWRRFNLGQSKIRTALSARCPPPELPANAPAHPARLQAAQVLAHLQAAFAGGHCPITAFQHMLHTFFV